MAVQISYRRSQHHIHKPNYNQIQTINEWKSVAIYLIKIFDDNLSMFPTI